MRFDALESSVTRFCADWTGTIEQVAALDSACTKMSSELDALKETIADLTQSRRSAPRSEKEYYRDQIREAREAKTEVVGQLRETRGALARARARQSELKRSEKELRHSLSTEQRRAARGAGKLAESAPLIGTQGVVGLSHKIREHHLTLQVLERRLDEAVKGSADSELVYLPEPPEPTFWPERDAIKQPLDLIEPPRFETYTTQSGKCSVATSIYSIRDGHDVSDLSQEHRGTFYAESYLRSMGHPVVMAIGGAGLVDMLSLDSTGHLWVTEVKETEKQRTLPASGLERTYSMGGKKTELHENEKAWLLRETPRFSHVDSVLECLRAAIDGEQDPAAKDGFRRLRDAYSEAAREGFSALSANKGLIQVGLSPQTGELAPPGMIPSRSLDEWIENVEPKEIVQIEVVVGTSSLDAMQDGQPASPEGGGSEIAEATGGQEGPSSDTESAAT